MDNMMILTANAAVWVFTLFYWWRKKGLFNTGVVVLALYTMMAIIAVPLFFNPLSFSYFEREVTIFPFVYLYVMLMLIMYPLLKMEEHKIEYIQLPPPKIINILCVCTIISTIYIFYDILPKLNTGLTLMLIDANYGADQYNEMVQGMGQKAMTGGIDIVGIVSNIFIILAYVFFFMCLLSPKKNKIILFGMVFVLLIGPLDGISKGSRTLVVMNTIQFIFLFLFLYRFMEKKLIKKIVGVGSIIGSIFFILFMALTLSRTQGDFNDAMYKNQRYFAEPMLVFNQNCLDANGTREGTWVAPLAVKALGGELLSIEEQRFKYRHMKIDNSRFYTFVGDYVLDFGPTIAFIIFVVYFMFFKSSLRTRRVWKTYHIILFVILSKFISGFYLDEFSNASGNFDLIFIIMWLILFYMPYFKKNKKSVYINNKFI